MSETAPKQRPQFRNVNVGQIITYRLPPSAKLSIMHRISGALLFLALPVLLLPILSLSLGGQEIFAAALDLVSHPYGKLIWLVLIGATYDKYVAVFLILTEYLVNGDIKKVSKK